MRRGLLIGVCLLFAAGFAALGLWQIDRRAGKLALIARVDARIHAAPAALPPRSAWHDDLSYRRVRAAGTFINDRETLVQAVTDLGPGWWVLTPLRSASGIVLVNRGFVPTERRDPRTRLAGQLAGQSVGQSVGQSGGLIRVTGLLRASEPGGGFLRRNDPAAGRWYSRDVAAIARARGLGTIAPFFIDADATRNPGGYPVGGLTVIAFPNAHLIYALTWFALAALSVGGAVVVMRTARQR